MSSPKEEELNKAPQVYYEKSFVQTFEGVPSKISYNLSRQASSIDWAICNQIIYTSPQLAKPSTGNTFFLALNRNRDVVIRSANKINGNYVVYDKYTTVFEDKRRFTETEPKEVGVWVTFYWIVSYKTELVFDDSGSPVYDPSTGLQKTKQVPVGLFPSEDTEILVEYHARKEIKPVPTLSSNKQFAVIPNEVAPKVEAGDLVVSYVSPTGTLIDR